MLAAGLIKDKEGIQAIELPEPKKIAEDEVLVEIIETAIDGTDKAIVKHRLFDPPEGESSHVLGHETVGRVVRTGEQVRSLKQGDLVVPTVRRGCNLCASCLHGQSDMCSTGLYQERGIHKLHGFFTKYICEHEQYLVKCPPELEELAVLVEPLSIGVKAIEQVKHIQSRLPWSCNHPEHNYEHPGWGKCKKALVIGAGPLGILATALLVSEGLDTYVAVNRGEDSPRVKLIQALGATYIDSREAFHSDIIKETGPLDLVLEASGSSQLALDMTAGLGWNAIYVMTGIPRGKLEVCLDGHLFLRQITRQNQVVIGSVNSNRRHFEGAIVRLASIKRSHGKTLAGIITDRFPLEEMEKAFSLGGEHIKVVLRP